MDEEPTTDPTADRRGVSQYVFDNLDRVRHPDWAEPEAPIRFVVYGALGVVVGALVAAFEVVVVEVALHELFEAPTYVQAAAPIVGLGAAALILRLAGRWSPSTSDEFVSAYHSQEELPVRAIPARMAAAIATLSSGGALGLEGPSIYLGATLGQRMGARLTRLLGPYGPRSLMAAGAAAGVAAVFQTPATGVLFALEVPYQRDIARRALTPALMAAAASYITYVLLVDSSRFLPIPSAEIGLTDEVFGALLLGVLAGVVARGLCSMVTLAKGTTTRYPIGLRVAVGGAVLAGCVGLARELTEIPVTLGPGAKQAVAVVLDPELGLWAIAAIFLLRAVATSATLAAGGVGGLFIPLVVFGLLLGRFVAELVNSTSPGLYPVIGLAAVLGAGYRTPLAAVMFVAESTGRSEFVIPALLATAVSQTLMGDRSVSKGQLAAREGVLERRMRLPVATVVREVPVLAPDESVASIVDRFASSPPAPALPVAGPDGYLGMLVLHDLAMVMFEKGMDAVASDVVKKDHPAVSSTATAVDAARVMGDLDIAVIAVIDEDGQPVGVVTALSLTGLDQVLDDLE